MKRIVLLAMLLSVGMCDEIFYDNFEDGNIDGWIVGGAGTANWDALEDDINATWSAHNANADGDAWMNRTFDVTLYENIKIDFYYKTQGLDSGEYFNFFWYNGTHWNNTVVDSQELSITQEIFDVFVQDGYKDDLRLSFVCNGNGNADHCYVDDVRIIGDELWFPEEVEIIFVNQTPPDVSSFNIFNTYLNITYNFTGHDLNYDNITLNYKINSTTQDNIIYLNGSYHGGWHYENVVKSNYTNYTWSLAIGDNQVYPATYNIDEIYMEGADKLNYTLDNIGKYIKIRLLNVSNKSTYSFFEVYAWNSTPTINIMETIYCNSSYSSGLPSINPNCATFGALVSSVAYNNTHGAKSKHRVVVFAMNTTTGEINGVKITSVSYFLLRGGIASNNWNVAYITNVTRTDQVQTSSTSGTSWTNFAGTPDAHLHQYFGDDKLNYYACITNTSYNLFCSSENRTDLIDLAGLPPSAPNVYSPVSETYNFTVEINYTTSISPNAYDIVYYNITALNSTTLEIAYIVSSNNSLNLGYVWDISEVDDGDYIIRVQVWDNQGQTNYGYSDNFTVKYEIPPEYNITLKYPENNSLNTTDNNTLKFGFNVSDGREIINCSMYGNKTGSFEFLGSNTSEITKDSIYELSIDEWNDDKTYMWWIICWDAFASNSSLNYTFSIDIAPTVCPPTGVTVSDSFCFGISEDRKICIEEDIYKLCIGNYCMVI